MADQFLSQDEVDALLAGVSGEAPAEAEEQSSDRIRAYDIARQERIVRGRMPTLEIVNERIARTLRTELFKLTRKSPEISVGQIEVQKYSAFLANMVVPTNLNLMQVRPLRGNALIVCEPQLVFTIIDTLFGGNGKLRTRIEGRDFSATEQRIIQQIVAGFQTAYRDGWDGVYPMDLDFVRAEMQTQFARIATPAEIVVSMRYLIEFGDATGAIHLCIPYGTLEPIREILCSTLSTDQISSEKQNWVKKLSQQLQDAELQLDAELAYSMISFGDLINLKRGDFIELQLRESAHVTVGRVPFVKCRYGVSNNRYALKIEDFLTTPQDLIKGAGHE
ncbi:MAG: flagellar motor switch protein FliM [Burkholderiaceae bacterium]